MITKSWFLKNKICTLVTLGIILDWIPGYIFGENTFWSGTKLLVLPLIVVDFFLNVRQYVSSIYGWIYLLGLTIGVGGGVFLGRIDLSRLISLFPTVLILFFFLKPKEEEDTINILKILFYASLLVPLGIVLSWLDIIEPRVYIDRTNYSRILVGVSWSSLGLYIVFISATMGGALFNKKDQGILKIFIAMGFASLGLVGVLLTAQRSSIIEYIITFVIASAMYLLKYPRKFLVRKILLGSIFLFVFIQSIPLMVENVGASFLYRIRTEDDYERNLLFERFYSDITNDTSFFGSGNRLIFADTGITTMHFIIGEAYYDGGIIFMVIVFILAFLSGKQIFYHFWNYRTDEEKFSVYSILLIIFIGYFIQLMTHPGLSTRLVYLMLGLWLSTGMKINAKTWSDAINGQL